MAMDYRPRSRNHPLRYLRRPESLSTRSGVPARIFFPAKPYNLLPQALRTANTPLIQLLLAMLDFNP